jgi:hypothetical protein
MSQKSNNGKNNGSTPENSQGNRYIVKDTNNGGTRHSIGGSNKSDILQTAATPVRPTGNPDKK